MVDLEINALCRLKLYLLCCRKIQAFGLFILEGVAWREIYYLTLHKEILKKIYRIFIVQKEYGAVVSAIVL